MFIAERELRKVIEYSLSTNFDVSSASKRMLQILLMFQDK